MATTVAPSVSESHKSHHSHHSHDSRTFPFFRRATRPSRDEEDARGHPSSRLAHVRKWSGEGNSRTMLRKHSRQRQQQAREEQERLTREVVASSLSRQPPRLQSINPLPQLGSLSVDQPRPDSYSIFNMNEPPSQPSQPPSRVPQPVQPAANFSRPGPLSMSSQQGIPQLPKAPPPPIPQQHNTPMDRAVSMSPSFGTNSLPRRMRRKKEPTPFNILVIGAKGSGKTTLISFLRNAFAVSSRTTANSPVTATTPAVDKPRHVNGFIGHFVETEISNERIGITLYDSVGLEADLIDLQLRELSAFVEFKFEETFVEEQKLMRSPGAKDTHIHATFLLLDPQHLDDNAERSPVGAALDEVDLQTLRALWGKTVIIPLISKADTLTIPHMEHLKRAVWMCMEREKLDPLDALDLEGESSEEDEEEDEFQDASEGTSSNSSSEEDEEKKPGLKRRNTNNRNSMILANGAELPYLPMSVLSPDRYANPNDKPGRRYAWGTASPFDPAHCDFPRLRESIFSEWRDELRELSRKSFYETWRTTRLKNLPGSRQRVKGGVTPVAAVPREGRTSPTLARSLASRGGPPPSANGYTSRPHTAVTNSNSTEIGIAVSPESKEQ